MRAAASMAKETFARLRREIAQIEGTFEHIGLSPLAAPAPSTDIAIRTPHDCASAIPFGLPKLDAFLTGGLRRAALHELRTKESRDAAAMVGFAASLLGKLTQTDTRPILWIVEKRAVAETGVPYGVGLVPFGIDLARLIVVRVSRPADVLWIFEEGLRCSGLAAVIAELQGSPRTLDLTASRRLALRAAEQGVMGLLLRQSGREIPSAASTRWLVASLPSSGDDEFPEGIGNPAWRLTLERNRHGATGAFDVEWNHDRRIFLPASQKTRPRPPLPSPPHRSPASPEQGKVVALAGVGEQSPLLPREEKRRRLRARG